MRLPFPFIASMLLLSCGSPPGAPVPATLYAGTWQGQFLTPGTDSVQMRWTWVQSTDGLGDFTFGRETTSIPTRLRVITPDSAVVDLTRPIRPVRPDRVGGAEFAFRFVARTQGDSLTGEWTATPPTAPVRRGRLTAVRVAAATRGDAPTGHGAEIVAGVSAARMRWNAALARRDSSALEQLVEDSAVHVSPQFTHPGRAAFLTVFLRAMTTRPEFRLSYHPERVSACEHQDCHVATEYGRWQESWLQEGEPTEVSGTYYAIWRRQGGAWRIRTEVFATDRCRGRRYCGT